MPLLSVLRKGARKDFMNGIREMIQGYARKIGPTSLFSPTTLSA
jgi:hypothetical protein